MGIFGPIAFLTRLILRYTSHADPHFRSHYGEIRWLESDAVVAAI